MATRLAALLVVAIVGTTLIAGLIVGAQRDDNSGPVDLIIHNARVYAADDLGSIADAVAIRGNKILKVGSEREIMRTRNGSGVAAGNAPVSISTTGVPHSVRLSPNARTSNSSS